MEEKILRLLTRDLLKNHLKSKGFTLSKTNVTVDDLIEFYKNNQVMMTQEEFDNLLSIRQSKKKKSREKYVETTRKKKIESKKQGNIGITSNEDLLLERFLNLITITRLRIENLDLKYKDLRI